MTSYHMTETMPVFDRARCDTAETRREAGRSIDAHLQRLQAAVLGFVEERGPRGATDEEIRLGLELSGDTARARRCELRDAGLIVDSGRRRKTRTGRRAVVWVSAATGARARPDQPPVATPAPIDHARQSIPDRPGPAAGDQAASWRCPRCACTTWQDVPIHHGRSTRRDCARCGRAVGFPVWHGQPRDLE